MNERQLPIDELAADLSAGQLETVMQRGDAHACESTPGVPVGVNAPTPTVELLTEEPKGTPFYIGRKFPLDGINFQITGLTASGFVCEAATLTNKGRYREQNARKAANAAIKAARAKQDDRPEGIIVAERYAQATANKAEKRRRRDAKREARRLVANGDPRSYAEIVNDILNPAPPQAEPAELDVMPGAIVAPAGSEAPAHV